MVGIPSSRGCQPCRRQKVKCDERRPACLRCTSNNRSCPGYPMRLKFIDERPKFKPENLRPSQQSLEHILPLEISRSVEEDLSLKIYQTFRPDLPAVKSVASLSKSTFVTDLPRHVGLSRACDLSMEALCLAHDTVLNPESSRSLVQSCTQYSRALAELQLCIADPERARTTGTLCAAMLLSMFEQLLCADFGASIRHAGGASRLIEASGPELFRDTFAYRMLHTLQGAIVVECILYRRRCFLDSPKWRNVCRRIQSPFNDLFSLLSRLPSILCTVQELLSESIKLHEAFLFEQITRLRDDLQKWRYAPAYAKLFQITTSPFVESFFHVNLSYTCRNAVDLLCTYAAMMILLNSALLVVSNPETPVYQLQNLTMAKEICQSYKYSRSCSPVGSLAIDFAFRVAYLVPDAQQKEWIVKKLNEMANPLGGPRHTDVKEAELEACFDYLRY